jgi:hypothetical protein
MNRRGFIQMLVVAPVASSLPWRAIASCLAPIAPTIATEITVSLDEVIAVTLRRHRAKIIENIFANNAMLKRLTQSNCVLDQMRKPRY